MQPHIPSSIRVVIIEKLALIREGLQLILEKHPNIEVAGVAADCEQAVEWVKQLHPHVILASLSMNDPTNSFDYFAGLLTASPQSKILILTDLVEINLQ